MTDRGHEASLRAALREILLVESGRGIRHNMSGEEMWQAMCDVARAALEVDRGGVDFVTPGNSPFSTRLLRRAACRVRGHFWVEKNSETDCCSRCGICRRGE